MFSRWKRTGPAVMWLAALLLATPVRAQDDRVVRGERVVIEIDEEGRLAMDGRPLAGDGPVFLRVRPSDGAVEVQRLGADRPEMRIERFFRSSRPAPGIAPQRAERRARQMAEEFRSRIREFEPLLEDVRDRFGRFAEERREIGRLEREARELATQARRAEGAERAELEDQLRAKLGELFDERHALETERVERQAEALREERERLDVRGQSRSEVIDRRLRTLMGEEDVLDW